MRRRTIYNSRAPRTQMGRQTLGRRGGGFRWKLMLVFAIGAAVYYFANQKTVPYTGRKQLRTMNPAQEMQLGLQSYQQILNDNRGRVQTRGPIVDNVDPLQRLGAGQGRQQADKSDRSDPEHRGSLSFCVNRNVVFFWIELAINRSRPSGRSGSSVMGRGPAALLRRS